MWVSWSSIKRAAPALLALVALATSAHAEPRATDVRIGVHPDKTRFVLELSEEPSYRIFTLTDPHRVVIDLPALGWEIPPDAETGRKGLVAALRFGRFSPTTSRVVLDLGGPAAIAAAFVLAPSNGTGFRLVVDLAPGLAAGLGQGPVESKTPLPRPKSAALPLTPAKPTSDDRPTVVIDAGHGGVDPGAIGTSGVKEKDLVLAYARELRAQLLRHGGIRVVMTRDEDFFLRLRDRIAIAQQAGGDLFISLHANTHRKPKIRGASVYSLSEKASDTEAEALAARENKADILGGVDLNDQTPVVSRILIDLAQRETMNLSKTFANRLVEELGKKARLLRNTHRSAGFAVLKSPTVTSVLLEVGYISNPQEEKLLITERHRKALCAAVARAIKQHFQWQEGLKRSGYGHIRKGAGG